MREQFASGDAAAAIRRAGFELRQRKSHLPDAEWKTWARAAVQHPIREILHQDPFTRHSFQRPRGYPGDALLLDFIYGHREPPPRTTRIGREIFAYTARTAPAPTSVRNRLARAAALIDDVASRVSRARVLSVGCGHLPEAELSAAFLEGRLELFTGIDADGASLAAVRERLGDCPALALRHASIAAMLRGHEPPTAYDMIYSLGLFDYLSDRLAARLLRRLAAMLAPGGLLLVANFMPHLHDAGYMEAFMRWELVYRTATQLEDLAAAAAPRLGFRCSTCLNSFGNIAYLELARHPQS